MVFGPVLGGEEVFELFPFLSPQHFHTALAIVHTISVHSVPPPMAAKSVKQTIS